MIILFILLVVLAIGICLWVLSGSRSNWEIVGTVITFCMSAMFLMITISLPLEHMGTNKEIQQFRAVELSVINARDSAYKNEAAALTLSIIDANKWLAGTKYWNGTLFDIWIPDEVEQLKPLK